MSTATETPLLDSATILQNARDLQDEIRAAGDEIERLRMLPPDLFEKLKRAGMIRLAMPRAWGGPEMDPATQIEVIEALSIADASVGWTVCILSDTGFYSGFLDDAVGRELFELDTPTAGMLAPVGRAEIVEGGYRVKGHWAFGSGSRHAEWFTGGCTVTRDGEIVMDDGSPRWRILFFPRDQVEVQDTWHVTGLAGSGSHDYEVDDVFVPEERAFDVSGYPKREGPLYRYHGLFFTNVPGIPLGLARAALDALIELALTRRTLPSMKLLRDEYRVQVAVAEAEGMLGAARSYVFDVMGDTWETLCAGDRLSPAQRARVGLMMVHTGQVGRRVVEMACDAAGSTALYRRHPLERMRRDAIALGSHLVHQAKTYQTVGAMLLGDESSPTFF